MNSLTKEDLKEINEEFEPRIVDASSYDFCEIDAEYNQYELILKPSFKETHPTADILTGDQQGRLISRTDFDILRITPNQAFCSEKGIVSTEIDLYKIEDIYILETHVEFRIKDYCREAKRMSDKINIELREQNRKIVEAKEHWKKMYEELDMYVQENYEQDTIQLP